MPVLATDNFNRADTIGPDMGQGWVNVTGYSADNGMQIVSNAVVPTTLASDKVELYTSASFKADQYAQADISVTGATSETGIGLALRGGFNGSYYRIVVNKGDFIHISKFILGAFTSLAFRGTAWTDGDTLRVEVQGTTIRVYRNGIQQGADITDASIVSGYSGVAYSSTSTSASLDNWSAGSINTAADDAPIGFLGRGAGW